MTTPPDPIPAPVRQWLDDNGKGLLARMSTNPLAVLTMGSGQRDISPAPPVVLQLWLHLLRSGEVAVLQSRAAFVSAARRASWSDATIRRGLGLRSGTDLDAWNDQVEQRIRHLLRSMAPADRPGSGSEG